MSNKVRGVTLVELLLSMTVFIGVLGAVFGVFIYGTRAFSHVTLRQGVEGDVRRISTRLKRDINMTDFLTVSSLPRTITVNSQPARRDAMAFVSLSDWNDPTNFQSGIPIPRWDQYVVWYATRGDSGQLVRQIVSPSGRPSDGWRSPYAGLGANLNDDPSTNASLQSNSVLSEIVERFEVQPELSEYTVTVYCRLKRRGTQKAGSGKIAEETLEFRILGKTKNSWPDL